MYICKYKFLISEDYGDSFISSLNNVRRVLWQTAASLSKSTTAVVDLLNEAAVWCGERQYSMSN